MENKYFTALNFQPLRILPLVKRSGEYEIRWTVAPRGAHKCLAFGDVDDDDTFDRLLCPENGAVIEKLYGPNHWVVWCAPGYPQAPDTETTEGVAVAMTGVGVQSFVQLWAEAPGKALYAALRFDGQTYVEVDVHELYARCALWERLTNDCARCGAATNQGCLRTLMLTQNVPGAPQQAPMDLLDRRRDYETDSYSFKSPFTDIPPNIGEWRFVSPRVATQNFFSKTPDYQLSYVNLNGDTIERFQEELADRSKAAARTRKMRTQHCASCPFELACHVSGMRWDSMHHTLCCRKEWDSIEEVADLLDKAAPKGKPLRHWLWLSANTGTDIRITGQFVKRRGKPLTTTRTYRLVWVHSRPRQKDHFELVPRYAGAKTIKFHSYGMLMRKARANGWEIEGLTDPKDVDVDEMHPLTRRLLLGLYRYFNEVQVCVRVRYKGQYYFGASPILWQEEAVLYAFEPTFEAKKNGARSLNEFSVVIYRRLKTCVVDTLWYSNVFDNANDLLGHNLIKLLVHRRE